MTTEIVNPTEGSPYGNNGYRFHADPAKAAASLIEGARVEYQPGDGTRYELELCANPHHPLAGYRYLVVRNFHCAIDLSTSMGAATYASRPYPVGGWYALRPILSAFDVTPGPVEFRSADRYQENSARSNGHDGEPLTHADAIIGRKVRRIFEAEVRPGKPER